METRYYTTFELAKMCHVNPATIVRWIHEGRIKTVSTAGGHFRISPDEIVLFLNHLKLPVPQELLKPKSVTKILIVDDEDDVRKYLRIFLEKYFPDFMVREAADGFGAGTALVGFGPHIVLLDLKLPGLDGFRVCEFIRKTPELKNARVIVLTGLAPEDAKEQIIKLGADDFLSKPCDSAMLKQTIENQLVFFEKLPKGEGG